MNFLKQIRKNFLFQNFSDEEINQLFDCLKGQIILKSKGMLVAKKDTPINNFCIILKGTLLKFSVKPNGSKIPIKKLNEGDMFGINKGYLENKQLGYFLVAASDVSLLYLDISSITTMCEKACSCHQQLIYNVFSSLCNDIKNLTENNNYISLKGMRYKIAMLIFDKYKQQNSLEIALGMDRNQMAAYLNVCRSSMSREMIKMREENIIDFWKDNITIKNISMLENIIKS